MCSLCSSWHDHCDLDMHHLQSSARSDQGTLERYTSSGTKTLQNKYQRCGRRRDEKYVTVWAHLTHMPTMSQIVAFLCFLSTSVNACQTQKHWWFGAQAADLCSVIAWIVLHAQHLLPAHTNCLFQTQTHHCSHYCQPDAVQSSLTCSFSLISCFSLSYCPLFFISSF